MSVAQSIHNSIQAIPAGRLFSYQELPEYSESPTAVIKAINRMVDSDMLKRLSKGLFYLPQKGLLGLRKPSDNEIIRSVLYKNGELQGYITGLSLYNKLGLTTQIPKTVTIASKGARQEKDFGTIRLKIISARAPIEENNVMLLQYLDVLKDIKNIPDCSVEQALSIIAGTIAKLTINKKKQLIDLAIEYYGPQVRALLGLILSNLGGVNTQPLMCSLNPTTVYQLNLNNTEWPEASKWNIQ